MNQLNMLFCNYILHLKTYLFETQYFHQRLNYLNFSETIKLLKVRGEAMQNAVPNGEGGMLAVLGSTIEILEKIITENKNNFIVQIANDNSEGQIVLSGKNTELAKLVEILKLKNIKTVSYTHLRAHET